MNNTVFIVANCLVAAHFKGGMKLSMVANRCKRDTPYSLQDIYQNNIRAAGIQPASKK